MSFGIEFIFIFGTPLTVNSMFFGDRFFMISLIDFWLILIKNGSPKQLSGLICSSLVRDLFPHTSTFYSGKTDKCQKHSFHFFLFFNKQKDVIHTCTFYAGKTYKFAVIVFTIVTKNST